MSKRFMSLVAILLGAAAPLASAQELTIGDPAPKIEVKEFIKGESLDKLEKGKTYVVEFWATWCGPCRSSIPHLTELQKKQKDVTFLGVSVWEQDQGGVKPFVDEMGQKMDYRVALDAVPKGGSGDDGAMAKTWMKAARENGIPTAFIINGDGKIAWIGHPMTMDEPLEKIVSGSWDLPAAIAQRKQAKAQQLKLEGLQEKLQKASQSGNPKALLAVLDQAIAEDSTLEPLIGHYKFQILLSRRQDLDKALDYGQHLVDQVLHESADGLNAIARIIGSSGAGKPNPKLIKLAVSAAERADKLADGKQAPIADTLAKAQFDAGDVAKALETQERAVRLAKGTPAENDEGMKERLEQYRKAAKTTTGGH
jgi:thiol-disulfide isomerase/thioredoxin